MIVSLDLFNSYTGNYEDNESAILLKESFISSAEEVIKGYLGFDPTEQEYVDVLISGNDKKRLYLPSRPITSLYSVSINDSTFGTNEFNYNDDYIYFNDYKMPFKKGVDNILVSFKAGWNENNMPSVIKLSILRIATLMLSETNGNIGLTGKSFSDNSRTFINYSNYRKYLQPLDILRIVRF